MQNRTRNRMYAIAAGVVLATATAGGVALAGSGPEGPGGRDFGAPSAVNPRAAGIVPFSADDRSGMCAETLSATSNLSQSVGAFDPADPIKACADGWAQMYPETPRPARFATCYHPPSVPGAGDGGASIVYPAGKFTDARQACASIGTDPIVVAAGK